MTGIDPAAEPPFPKRYLRLFVLLLFLVCLLNYVDRVIFLLLAQPIKEELALSDLQLGFIGGLAFAIFNAVLGLPIARLADRHNRVRLIAGCVATWSAMTALCGLTGSYVQLLLARIGVGIGEAGFLPPTASLVGDHFPPAQRGSVVSLIHLGAPLSGVVAAILTGTVAATWGWRVAFLVAGLPGFLLAILLVVLLREPARGRFDGAVSIDDAPSLLESWRYLVRQRLFRHLLLAGGLATAGMASISQFLPVYFIRVVGLDVTQAAALYGSVNSIAGALGILIGGFGMDRLARRDPRWRAWGPAIGLVLAAGCYLLAFADGRVAVVGAGILFASIALFTYVAPTLAMLQNLVGSRLRASTVAIYGIACSLFGAGLGPTLFGWVSDLLATASFAPGDFAVSCPGGVPAPGRPALETACRAASAAGVRQTMLLWLPLFVWSALHYLLAARSLRPLPRAKAPA